MAVTELQSTTGLKPIVNDFCMTVCTVNGSGSATANNIIYRALYQMGIPVSGKNIFPSNIMGMATWFVIRVNDDGFIGRVPHDDIVVAMNPGTLVKETAYLPEGGVIFYADHITVPEGHREDLIYYPMPIKELIKTVDVPRNFVAYLENMLYVGIVSQVLGIELSELRIAVEHQFIGRDAIIESNFGIIKLGYEWAAENVEKRDRFVVERRPFNNNLIMTDGNTAAGIGSLFGGLQFCSWYPITPATSMVEAAIAKVDELRKDPVTGKTTCVILQVEDELAAAGAAVGAGWAGLRSMTSTSGPGICLMAENIGLAYFTETPVVIWNVQRVGPSTGLPTRTAQGDLSFMYNVGHGDINHIILIPGTVNECFEFGWKSLDIAERYQTPIFVLSDLDLGMNTWVTEKFEYPSTPIDRGKLIWEEELEKIEDWGRYKDIDGDGIPYRTVMGNQSPKSAYFTRGTGHDVYGNYNEDPKNWSDMLHRIEKKINGAIENLPRPVVIKGKDARIGIIGMGSTNDAIRETQAELAKQGIETDYMRIRALPSCCEVREFIEEHERTYVLELNRDGQLKEILMLEHSDLSEKLISLTDIGGLPMTAVWAVENILAAEEEYA